MYLKTPKRYTYRGQRQRRRVVTPRRLLLWPILIILIIAGVGVYQNRAMIQPIVNQMFDDFGETMATASAPTPTPLPDAREQLTRADEAWNNGSIEEAVRLYQVILPAVPNAVEPHYRVTLGLIINGQYSEALIAAENTVTADPYSADAWAINAWTLEWNGRPLEGIVYALHALELDPQNARAMAWLSEAQLTAGQPDAAFESATAALELNPQSPEAFRARARIYSEALSYLNYDAARADFRTAYELDPNNTLLAVDLAIVESITSGSEAAIAILRDVIDRNPRNTTALYWLGVFYFRDQGNPEQALQYLQDCVEVNPDSVLCNYYLGRVQYSQGDVNSADVSFQRAINNGTTNPQHYYFAAQAKISLGECPAALPLLQTGYQFAQAQDANEDVINNLEASLRTCGSPVGIPVEVTPEATPSA